MRDSLLRGGTVTFLFTDIEGSTRLLDALGPERYAQALQRYRRVCRDAFAVHGGTEVDNAGDGFFAAFPTASGALNAARDAEAALVAGPIRVRIGIHTGEPLKVGDGYVGMDVHRAARIAAAAHGGQVVLSAATRGLVGDAFELSDLGEHRLKDLAAPERVYQLGVDPFPPLRSIGRTNLPVPSTSFLGRADEISGLVQLLTADSRLVTLTGPGGTGKTRLALQAAAEAADAFPDGVWWVPLAPLRDPSLVMSAVAIALDATMTPGRDPQDSVLAAIERKRALLLLDNAEHLMPAAAATIARLRDAVQLTVLVTSRERLQLTGERVYPVPALEESNAVALFVARARDLNPSFSETPGVGELCARLDYLPLAVELAAARTSLFTPEQLVARLGQRLDLFQGSRDTDPRQFTLRATIEWSHDLLTQVEKRLFALLSVFAGGCTFEAAERVANATPETLLSLIDKNLIRRRDDAGDEAPRYWMLETIREFARERLDASGERSIAESRLVDAAVEFAQAAHLGLSENRTREWAQRFASELDNLRQATQIALDRDDPVRALKIAVNLGWLWQTQVLREGRDWIETARARAGKIEPALEGHALLTLGCLALDAGDYLEAERLVRTSLPLLATGRPDRHAFALSTLGIIRARTDPDEAHTLFTSSKHVAHALGNNRLVSAATEGLALCAALRGDRDAARALYAEAIQLSRSDRLTCVSGLSNFAEFLIAGGDLLEAGRILDETFALLELDETRELGVAYFLRGYLELGLGRRHEAIAALTEARTIAVESGAIPVLAYTVLGEASVEARWGEPTLAVRLWSQARGLGAPAPSPAGYSDGGHACERRFLEPLILQLDAATFATAWAAGQSDAAAVTDATLRQTGGS